jgi:hypothetical protein
MVSSWPWVVFLHYAHTIPFKLLRTCFPSFYQFGLTVQSTRNVVAAGANSARVIDHLADVAELMLYNDIGMFFIFLAVDKGTEQL